MIDTNSRRQATALVLSERKALREDVREAIVNAILQGEFRPGERIIETRIARQLKVSQTTVREALREIEQIGMIISNPNRGVIVRPMTRRDVLEMYEMRALLEAHAARLASVRVTDEEIDQLAQLVEEMIRLGESGDARGMIALDVRFHSQVCSLSDNHLLIRLWSTVNPHLWTYVAVQGLLGLSPAAVARRHEVVLDALRSKDADQAEQAMRDHLLELRELADTHLRPD